MEEFRVFISAVSSEFRAARLALTNDLVVRGVTVKVQEQFLPDRVPRTLLAALEDYIATCTTVVCVIGRRSGDWPEPAETEPFPDVLPDGVTHASYTQWEYYFARKHAKECLLYFAADDYRPDDETPAGRDDPALQRAFIARIRPLHYDGFATVDALCRRVGLHHWPPPIAARPNNLRHASIGALFIGRDDAMRQLRASLTRAGGNAATITARHAIHGLGGIGKTRLAVEYAQRYADDYTALLFVEAETPEQLHAQLAALVGELRLPQAAAQDDEARLTAVLQWLQANPGWLLIVDNVDTIEALAALTALMGRLTQGHVLLTSRLAGFSAAFAPLELDVLRLEHAAAFLLDRSAGRRIVTGEDDAEATALARELGQLALALEHAGAYIAVGTPAISLADYRARLRDSFDSVMQWSQPEVTQYPRAVAATWQTSVARLDLAARALLVRLAFLAPEPIPASLFAVPMRGLTPPVMRQALADLAGYSLVANVPGGGGVVVHRLVQDVTRRQWAAKRSRLLWLLAGLTPRRMRRRLRHSPVVFDLDWLSAAFTGEPQDSRTWVKLDPLAPHTEAVVVHADAAGILDPTGELMNRLGMLFLAKALFAQAEPLLRRAFAISEASLGKDHPNVARGLNNLAALLQDTNRLGEAEPMLRRVLASDEASLGRDHPNVAIRLNNLAALLQAANRLGEAEPLVRRALAIDEASLGMDHPHVALRLNNLAALLHATNRLGEAEPLMRRALAIDETSFGKDHPDVARDLNNLAASLQDTNRLGEAEPLMRRALAIDAASLGKDHPTVARDLSNLAGLLHATNRLREAEPLMRRALAIDAASLGEHHPTVAIRLNNLAQLLQATNRLGEAEPLLRRALAISEASLGKDHPTVATRLNNLATLLRSTNRLGEAEPLLRRALVIFLAFQRDTGHAHPHRDLAVGNYTQLLRSRGKSAAAINLALAALWREAGLNPE